LSGVDVLAESELEVSHVAGSQFYSDCDVRSRIVFAHSHALTEFATVLVWSRDGKIESITTFAALTAIRLVLTRESAAEQFVVVVIRWRAEAVSVGKSISDSRTNDN
jgi:hypothetical protein